MPSAVDFEAGLVKHFGPCPIAFDRAFGQGGADIDACQSRCGSRDSFASGDHFADQFFEMAIFCRERMGACFGDAGRFFVEAERVETDRTGHGLAMGKSAVRRHQLVTVFRGDFDEIAKHLVMLDLE